MHAISEKTYLTVFIALMLLLAITVGAAFVDLGRLHVFVSIGIALAKTILILLFFMHLRYSSHLIIIFAGIGIIWWSILLVIVASDYLSRGWLPGG